MKHNLLRQAVIVMMASATLLGCKKTNPDYNPETREVTAQFVLNVSAADEQPQTKNTIEAVQKDYKFRGLDKAVILTYNTEGGANPYVKSTSVAAGKRFDMGTLYTTQAYWTDTEKQNDLPNNSHSQRVLHLTIPIGTDAVLFYGKAPVDDTPQAVGSSIMEIKDKAEDTEIKVVRRMAETQVTSYDQTAALMIYVVNRIISSEIADATDADAATYGYPKNELRAVSWKSYGHQYEINNELYGRTGTKKAQMGLEEILGKIYSSFTYIKTGEFRSGSSDALKGMMKDMYAAVQGVVSATPTSAAEANAKRLAVTIQTRMNNYFDGNWNYKTNSEIKDVAKGVLGAGMTDSEWDAFWAGNYGSASDLNKYPYGDFNIPEGAAQFAFDRDNDVFSYKHPNAALVTPGITFEPRKYVYPAELMYFVNSPIRTTETANLQTSDFPDGVANWNDESNTGKWKTGNWTKNSKVLSSTRGVAVVYYINYGVAMLQSSIAWSTEALSAGKIKDNRSAMTGGKEGDRDILLDQANLSLRGILVGGVNPRYNWQFLRKYAVGEYQYFDGVIYDDKLECPVVPTHAGEYNYTLVYDNYDRTITDQSDVYIALEFVNNGDDFWGKDNLIRSGSVFYLAAKLTNDATNKSSITWPTDHQIPPIWGVDGEEVPSGKVAGASKQIPRVFIQDFVTSALFRIGVNSLKHAYVSVPDLRSSQMSLGLSVDLKWNPGYTYDLEFAGVN